MTRRLIAVAFVLGTFLSSGCGTCVNFVKPHDDIRVFGGVRWDCEKIEKYFDNLQKRGDVLSPGCSDSGAQMGLLMLAVPFVELALTFVGDTITFPLSRWLDKRQARLHG